MKIRPSLFQGFANFTGSEPSSVWSELNLQIPPNVDSLLLGISVYNEFLISTCLFYFSFHKFFFEYS